MNVFAGIGIVDIVVKLLIVLLLKIFPADVDRLIGYSFMGLCWGLIKQMIYFYYCSRHFEECRTYPALYKAKIKPMFSFATWNFIGCSAALLKGAGVNLLLFQFFGPVLTAAKTISGSVNNAVSSFAGNFMTELLFHK